MLLPTKGEFTIGGFDLPIGAGFPTLQLLMRDGLCLVMEASTGDIEINGQPVRLGTALLHGDLITIRDVELAFSTFDELREPNLEAAILRDPDADEPWLVYADWLQEQGDPLGERITAERTGRSDERWLEALWQHHRVEATWRHGMLDGVILREGVPSDVGTLRAMLARLFSLRAAAFLRALSVDLVGDARHPLARPELRAQAEALVAALPALPALERLSLGYHLEDDDPPAPVHATGPRFPRLSPAPVFTWARRALIEVEDARGLVGAHLGDRFTAPGARIEAAGHRLALGRIGTMRDASELFGFDAVGGRVMLRTRDEGMRRLTVNGRPGLPSLFLLPGDVIALTTNQASLRLKFLVEE